MIFGLNKGRLKVIKDIKVKFALQEPLSLLENISKCLHVEKR